MGGRRAWGLGELNPGGDRLRIAFLMWLTLLGLVLTTSLAPVARA